MSVQATIDKYVSDSYARGIVALIGHGDGARVATAGVTPRDTIFRLTSNTKPVTAIATLLLVQDGRFALGDSVERWLPELAGRKVLKHLGSELTDTVPAKRAITVEDLLSFRPGFGHLWAPPGRYPIQRAIAERQLMGFGPPDPRNPLDFDTFMKRLGELPLVAQPGEEWHYSAAANVLGVLIERASGMKLADFYRTRIFEPLGMKDTAFYVPADKIARLAACYHRENGQLVLDDDPKASAWATPPTFAAGDAGLVSTVDDMFALARMFLAHGRPLLAECAIKDMTTDHLTRAQRLSGLGFLGKGTGWGYGGSVNLETTPDGRPKGTYGWGGGFGTTWFLDPTSRVTSICLTQTKWDAPEIPQVHRDVMKIAFTER